MKSKTIILSPTSESGNSRGIITLYIEDELLKCKLRLYSCSELTPECKLGIYHNNEVYTANLLNKGGQYESSFVGDFNIDQNFYCAIINTANNNSVVLAGGTYAGYYFNNSEIFTSKENMEKEPQPTQTPSPINCEDCQKCKSCKYKEYFYSQKAEIQTDKAPQNQPTQPTILDSITPQINHIFNTYPQNKTLTKLIPNSQFVEIKENGEEYSIGAIYENETLKYISYAIKSNYNLSPPKELGKHYQWLPIDAIDPLSEGYYLVFQDAKDLKILEL